MNKREYAERIVGRLTICFVVLLLITLYEIYYYLTSYSSGLSLVLALLAGAVTYFAHTLKSFFEDIRDGL